MIPLLVGLAAKLLPRAIEEVAELLLPHAAGWLAPALAQVLPGVIDIVDDLSDDDDLTGQQKFDKAARLAGELFDKAFDGIPRWKALPEDRRDRIIAGLVELAVFASEPGDRESRKERKALRRAMRRAG